MPPWMQHLLVVLIVAGCVAWLIVRAIRGHGKAGCACPSCPATKPPSKPNTIVLIPAQSLRKKKQRRNELRLPAGH